MMYTCLDACMHGRMNGWMNNAYMVGYIDYYGDAWMDIVWVDDCMHAWMMDVCMNACTDECRSSSC